MNEANSLQDVVFQSDSYKKVLPNYNSNKQFLLRKGFNQLKIDMGFTQIRFYCFKKKRGRVFHIMTNKEVKGKNAVNFFTTSNTMRQACGSFTRLPDDTSTLAKNCDKWGFRTPDRWGHQSYLNDKRLFQRPIVWANRFYYSLAGNPFTCDDNVNGLGMSLGDTWKIFVR